MASAPLEAWRKHVPEFGTARVGTASNNGVTTSDRTRWGAFAVLLALISMHIVSHVRVIESLLSHAKDPNFALVRQSLQHSLLKATCDRLSHADGVAREFTRLRAPA